MVRFKPVFKFELLLSYWNASLSFPVVSAPPLPPTGLFPVVALSPFPFVDEFLNYEQRVMVSEKYSSLARHVVNHVSLETTLLMQITTTLNYVLYAEW